MNHEEIVAKLDGLAEVLLASNGDWLESKAIDGGRVLGNGLVDLYVDFGGITVFNYDDESQRTLDAGLSVEDLVDELGALLRPIIIVDNLDLNDREANKAAVLGDA